MVVLFLGTILEAKADTLILAGDKVLDVQILRLEGDTLVYKVDNSEWKTNILEVKSFIIKPDPKLEEEIKILKKKTNENGLVIKKAQSDLAFFKDELNRLRKENLALRAGKAIVESSTQEKSSLMDYLSPEMMEELQKMYEEERNRKTRAKDCFRAAGFDPWGCWSFDC